MTIAQNVAAREAAEDAYTLASELIKEEIQGDPDATSKAWEILRNMVVEVAQLPIEPPPQPNDMDDAESRVFENKKMGFGQHEGVPIKDVPLKYLAWVDEKSDFNIDLRRYLKRRDIQVWQEMEEE